jgi:hypothetical protein
LDKEYKKEEEKKKRVLYNREKKKKYKAFYVKKIRPYTTGRIKNKKK